MIDRESSQWPTLSERRLLGEQLSDEELRRLQDARDGDPACAIELGVLDELAQLIERPGLDDARATAIARHAVVRAEQAPVDAQPAPRDRWARWTIAGVCAAAAAAMLTWWWPVPRDPATARLSLASGEVRVDGRPIGQDAIAIANGATIAVEDGRACIRIEPAIDVCLDEHTRATVRALDEPTPWVEVMHGHAVARLDARPQGLGFALGTEDLRVTAVGTIFSLAVDEPNDAATAAVIEGVVELRAADQVVRLAARDVARVAQGRVEIDRLDDSAQARDLELIAPVSRLFATAHGHLAITTSPPGAAVRIDEIPVGRSPMIVALPEGEHRVELADPEGVRVREAIRIDIEGVVQRRFDLAPVASDAIDPRPEVAAPIEDAPPPETVDVVVNAPSSESAAPGKPIKRVASGAAMLAEARSLRLADQSRAAAEVYQRLIASYPRSSEAQTALVSLGDLQLDRLAQPKAAARSYGRYLARGGGALAQEARYGRIRAFRAASDRAHEAEAIEEFLAHHPKAAHAESLRSRLAALRSP